MTSVEEKNGNSKPKEAKKTPLTWEERDAKKLNMAKERNARVMKITSPIGSTLFNMLQQYDPAYANFKLTLGERIGVPHEEAAALMEEGRKIVLDFNSFVEKLCNRLKFKYFPPEELSFFQDEQGKGAKSFIPRTDKELVETRPATGRHAQNQE